MTSLSPLSDPMTHQVHTTLLSTSQVSKYIVSLVNAVYATSRTSPASKTKQLSSRRSNNWLRCVSLTRWKIITMEKFHPSEQISGQSPHGNFPWWLHHPWGFIIFPPICIFRKKYTWLFGMKLLNSLSIISTLGYFGSKSGHLLKIFHKFSLSSFWYLFFIAVASPSSSLYYRHSDPIFFLVVGEAINKLYKIHWCHLWFFHELLFGYW